MSDWCTIESDPGVFTSLIESFGAKNVELTELWSMDDDSLSNLVEEYGKVYGLIFLFKWNSGSAGDELTGKPLSADAMPPDLFFAKQVVTNACATQAILSVLLNVVNNNDDNENNSLILGPTLEALKSFTMSFPPDLKGEAIGASDEIRNAHNSFSRKESFLIDNTQKRIATDDDDIFHFIAYVPHGVNNHEQSPINVYELDGLQAGPILSGTIEDTNSNHSDLAWLQIARSAIQTRIEKYAATEIKFNLMALTADKRVRIQSKINSLLEAGIGDDDESLTLLQATLANEEEKREHWKEENERRRHNYLPLCVELIRAIASSGKLPEYTNKATERMIELSKKKMMQNKK